MKKLKTFEQFVNENHISPRDINSEYYDQFKSAVEKLANDLVSKEFSFKDIEDTLKVELNHLLLPIKKVAKK